MSLAATDLCMLAHVRCCAGDAWQAGGRGRGGRQGLARQVRAAGWLSGGLLFMLMCLLHKVALLLASLCICRDKQGCTLVSACHLPPVRLPAARSSCRQHVVKWRSFGGVPTDIRVW